MNESGLGLSMAGSETIGSGELHGACLTTDDVDRIQSFINEFCLKSLLPHIERQMKLLGEAVSLIFNDQILRFSNILFCYRRQQGRALIDPV